MDKTKMTTVDKRGQVTDAFLRAIKPTDEWQRIKVHDHLVLLVDPISKGGKKWWRTRFKDQGHDSTKSFGQYPDVSFKQAKDLYSEFAKARKEGRNPIAEAKKAKVAAEKEAAKRTFKQVAASWIEARMSSVTPKTKAIILARLRIYVYPDIGDNLLHEIKPYNIINLYNKINKSIHTKNKIISICSRVFRYAVAIGECEYDPCSSIKDALQPNTHNNHLNAAITPTQLQSVVQRIEKSDTQPVMKLALWIIMWTGLRVNSAIGIRRDEVDFKNAKVTIDSSRMKSRNSFTIPLPNQAMIALKKNFELFKNNECVLQIPGKSKHIHCNSVLNTLRSVGIAKDEATVHGFRSSIATLLNQACWPRDLIDRQLDHVVGGTVSAIYNRADYMELRSQMMQRWADFLDEIKVEGSDADEAMKKLRYTGTQMI